MIFQILCCFPTLTVHTSEGTFCRVEVHIIISPQITSIYNILNLFSGSLLASASDSDSESNELKTSNIREHTDESIHPIIRITRDARQNK